MCPDSCNEPVTMSFLSTFAARRRRFRYVGEALSCNLCGSSGKAVIGTRDRFLNPLTNVICTHCGLIRVDPMPTDAELDRYYTDHYRLHYQNTLEPTPKTIERGKRGAEARLDMLAKFLKPGARILDIGAGGGEFLAEAKKRGYEVEGVEPSIGFARYAERTYGVKVHVAPLMKIDFGGRKFDLVHSFHVFEHLRDPIASMRLVHSLLNPDGHFYIAVPDMAEDRTPTGMFHFAHVYGFTYETLLMMAAKAGFEWIPRGAKGAAQVFRRIEQSDPNWFRFPDHARELEERFRRRGLFRHLLTAEPYRRAWLRLLRKIRERKLSSTRA
jgi:2-polyprenyl-3-methyl-5-hydroxy-6-metoxy-1,4-benzoquinol methylase